MINPTDKQDWIPCSERLPDTDGLYLITVKVWSENGKHVVSRMTHADNWVEDDWWHFSTDDVIAWAEMPEPYEGGAGGWTS